MSLAITKINPYFEDVMPQEYLDLCKNGPFGNEKKLIDLGTFKELLEEHPLCAGCNLALAFRVMIGALPNPEDSILVGSTGCNSLAYAQLGLHNIHSLFGNQNAIAAGLKAALRLRFPDKVKDVIVMAGDGATADIGLDMTLHSWFRGDKFTTVMFDNELYANTGGQESGMSLPETVMYMAPKGKRFKKINMPDIAIASGCQYVAVVTTAKTKSISECFKKAVLIAREIGPTYIQIFTPCPTNLKVKTSETRKIASEREKNDYRFREYISDEAKKFLESFSTKQTKSVTKEYPEE